jgi:hypothetical protein
MGAWGWGCGGCHVIVFERESGLLCVHGMCGCAIGKIWPELSEGYTCAWERLRTPSSSS